MERLGLELSVKTRLGIEEPEEFDRLLSIYNRFPLKELIIHPRVLKDFYKYTLQCVIMAILLTGSPMNDLQPRILRWMQ